MSTLTEPTGNQLGNETSPYLLQHAENPVHWLPWNEQSLALAKQLDRPILLSVGYSACHWCHVMAHESFEDPDTADIMNRLFINIKVDKEERPDLDKIYQSAHTLLTERPGGWPLTLFLTPDTQMPIYAGTYFPPEPRHNLPAFRTLLQQISDIWQTRKADIQQQSEAIQTSFQRFYENSRPADTLLSNTPIDIARSQIEQQFDPVHGGFSRAPKFPHPAIIDFALRHWCQTAEPAGRSQCEPAGDRRILHCALHTLERMAEGGIFDHLGGGFCRYSTDDQWIIPHFEKMLYDNGPLLALYTQAWAITGKPVFSHCAQQTADWVMREMQSTEGGYYAAQDADSEGEEGRFFVWQKKEIDTLLKQAVEKARLPPLYIALYKTRFGLDRPANFEGRWHLHGYVSEAALASKYDLEPDELHQAMQTISRFLFNRREQRVHPATDTKILCAWNGLMIHGMATAGRLLGRTDYTQSAIQATDFIRTHLWRNGRLLATYNKGRASLNAYLDDYAFLIHGLLELLQNQWDNGLYEWTLQLADALLEEFEDHKYGGFFFTGRNHEKLIQQIKGFSDDAIPSGNAIAAISLGRLGYLSGRPAYLKAAERCLQSAWSAINQAPISHCAMLNALREQLTPHDLLIIRKQNCDSRDWPAADSVYLPFASVYTINAQQPLHSTLREKAVSDNTIAYLCNGMQCSEPLINPAELESYLSNNSYRILE
ncbi:MAG TPA: thioredoxin domain-containing protein [Gammaproteobacteria bacterium]|nr:thioredoxin domain-containing protein [Gammaproteobacteria bacterium]